MTGFLASVTSVEEASMLLGEADIIDLKNPALGALGALPHQVVEAVVRFVDGRKPVSATVGDLPMVPEILVDAVSAMALTGVDVVKVGFFGQESHIECARALGRLTEQCKMVAVMLADQQPDFLLLDTLAGAGFYGAMLDTAGKSEGGLTHWLPMPSLRQFVGMANARNLLTGLAGSLRETDIVDLVEMGPDYLGFRGALCVGHQRQEGIQWHQAKHIAGVLRECNSGRSSVFV